MIFLYSIYGLAGQEGLREVHQALLDWQPAVPVPVLSDRFQADRQSWTKNRD